MTAGLWLLAFMVTHKGLHNGMVCGVHVGVERKGALSLAVVRRVSLRSDDPVLEVGGRGVEEKKREGKGE